MYIVLPDSLTTIGQEAFADCENLRMVYIPKSVIGIGREAFNNCPRLTIYGEAGSYAETYARQNELAFVAVTSLTDKDIVVTGDPQDLSEAQLVVTEAPDAVNLVAEEYRKMAVGYTVSLQKDGQTVQPDHSLIVRIPVPDTMVASRCRVLYVGRDAITEMSAALQNGCMVFASPVLGRFVLVQEHVLGDVDENGEITVVDALMTLQAAAEAIPLDHPQQQDADVNGDAAVTAEDALLILKYATGAIASF